MRCQDYPTRPIRIITGEAGGAVDFTARAIARNHLARYLPLPNYANNLRRLGFGDADFASPGSDRLVDAVVAWGDVDAISARVDQHRAAGADHVCIQVLRADYDFPFAEWRALAPALVER